MMENAVQWAQVITAVAAVVSSFWAIRTALATSKHIQMRERAEAHARRAIRFEDAVSVYFASMDALKNIPGGSDSAKSHSLSKRGDIHEAERKLRLLLSADIKLEKVALDMIDSFPKGGRPRDSVKIETLWKQLAEIIEGERLMARKLRERAK